MFSGGMVGAALYVADAALSWTLPSGEARVIAQAFRQGDEMPPWVRTRVEALKKWFGNGGK